MELLTPTAHQTFSPVQGQAHLIGTIRVGGRISEDAVWG